MKQCYLKTANRFFINCIKIAALIVILSTSVAAQDQQGLVFKNPVLVDGKDKEDGALYRFPNVTTNVDALVTISGRSSSRVKLSSIDLTNTGWDKAFQPQVSYNSKGSIFGSDWWMEFEISFVNTNTGVVVPVPKYNLTAIDIDGDGNRVHEYVSLYGLKSYTVENRSLLSITNILENLLGILTNTGKKFVGSLTEYDNIDTSATRVMTTAAYENKSQFRIRAGGTSSAGSVSADRMYSFWFKSFSYQAPVEGTLPVTLSAFTARKAGSGVILNWSTEIQKNVSHFVVQRSVNGTDFTDAGIVFTNESNSTMHRDYSFTDDIKTVTANLIYYRLKTVDLDGKYEQSPVRIIRTAEDKDRQNILVYPNPVVSEVRVTLPVSWQGKQVTIQVINANGVVVKNITSSAAGQTENMNVGNLQAGLYIVKAVMGKEIAVQQLVKLK